MILDIYLIIIGFILVVICIAIVEHFTNKIQGKKKTKLI